MPTTATVPGPRAHGATVTPWAPRCHGAQLGHGGYGQGASVRPSAPSVHSWRLAGGASGLYHGASSWQDGPGGCDLGHGTTPPSPIDRALSPAIMISDLDLAPTRVYGVPGPRIPGTGVFVQVPADGGQRGLPSAGYFPLVTLLFFNATRHKRPWRRSRNPWSELGKVNVIY
jgi:hypothetical protein